MSAISLGDGLGSDHVLYKRRRLPSRRTGATRSAAHTVTATQNHGPQSRSDRSSMQLGLDFACAVECSTCDMQEQDDHHGNGTVPRSDD